MQTWGLGWDFKNPRKSQAGVASNYNPNTKDTETGNLAGKLASQVSLKGSLWVQVETSLTI